MIHKYKMFGENIVLDVNSNSVHLVDEIVYDVLEYFQDNTVENIINKLKNKYDEKEIIEVFDEIEELKVSKQLFSEDIYKEIVKQKEENKSVVKALCLHIAHDCNLKCKYCFASEGNYKKEKSYMSLEVGKAAIDFVIKNSGNRKNIEIDFFGGEPLINFEVVKDIVHYARNKEKEFNKNFRFTITTNGLLLNDEIKKFINENMGNIVMSIDGRKEINDKMRQRYDNKSTYDSIIDKFKETADSRNQDNYYVRGTFTRENLDFSEDVLHLAKEGFKQISIEPVVADKDTTYAIREEDVNTICKEYEKLAKKYVEMRNSNSEFNFFHFMINLENGPCALKRISGCGAGFEYLAVTPEGELYPCHQFVGIDGFKLGSVFENNFNNSIANSFKKLNIYNKDDCAKCWAKFFCSGGCAANAYQFNNDINIPYKISCDLLKKRIECAIWIKSQC